MKAAKIENNIVTAMIEVPSLTCYAGVTLVAINETNCNIGDTYNGSIFIPKPITLDEAKSNKLAQINTDKNKEMYADITYESHIYQADTESQQLLSNTINLVKAGLTLPSNWIDKSNVKVPITTIDQLIAMADLIRNNVQLAIFKARDRKDALNIATTIEQVNVI